MAKESLAGREGLFTPLSWDDIKLTHPVGGLLISFFVALVLIFGYLNQLSTERKIPGSGLVCGVRSLESRRCPDAGVGRDYD